MTPQELENSILQFAIQGKLIEQRPEEGTAEALYVQIQRERQQLIKEGKIKKETLLPKIIESEKPFEIPESWMWVRLDDLVIKNIKRGKSPKYANKSSVLVFAQKCNTKFGKINLELAQYLDESTLSKYPQSEFIMANDIVVNSTGTGTMGRVGIIKSSDGIDDLQVVPDSHVAVVRVTPHLDIMFMFYVLRCFQPFLESKGGGSTNQKELKPDTIRTLIIPLPPFAEQKRIVAKIEELLPLLNRYEQTWKRLEAFNNCFPEDMKKSLLQYAIQGKLVEQRPDEGTAEELYTQIQQGKQRLIKEGKIKKEKRLPQISEEEKPFDIPESWMWVRIQDITILNPKNNLDDALETSFVPMPLIDGGFQNHHTFELRPWGKIKKGFTHFADGDIGIAKITPCFQNRKSVVFRNLRNGYGAGTTELSIVRVIDNLLSQNFLLYFFKSAYFIENGVKSFTGTAGQQRVHKDYLQTCLFPLPPLAEQKRIVDKIEKLLSLCERLK